MKGDQVRRKAQATSIIFFFAIEHGLSMHPVSESRSSSRYIVIGSLTAAREKIADTIRWWPTSFGRENADGRKYNLYPKICSFFRSARTALRSVHEKGTEIRPYDARRIEVFDSTLFGNKRPISNDSQVSHDIGDIGYFSNRPDLSYESTVVHAAELTL